MSTLRNTKNRIKSVQTTAKVTNAMKSIAAMRLKKFAIKAGFAQKYATGLWGSLNRVLRTIPTSSTSELLRGNLDGKILLIIVSPSRGFCGGLHRTSVTETIKYFDLQGTDISDASKVDIITINRPAKRMISKTGGKILASFDGPYKEIDTYAVLPISELVNELWKGGEYQSVFLSYATSNSAFKAAVRVESILPLINTIQQTKQNSESPVNIDTETDPLITEALALVLQSEIHLGLLSTQTAEEGARMMAMSQATDNAKELEKKLNLVYFRQRQAKITQEIAELVGGNL